MGGAAERIPQSVGDEFTQVAIDCGDARRDFGRTMKRIKMSVRGELMVHRVNAHQGIEIGGAVRGRRRGTGGRNWEGKDEN